MAHREGNHNSTNLAQAILNIGYANGPDLQVETGVPVMRDFLEDRISPLSSCSAM